MLARSWIGILIPAVAFSACEKTDRLYCASHPTDQPYCPTTDASLVDGVDALAIDAPPDAPTCVGGVGWTVCLSSPPMTGETLFGNLNTDTSVKCLATLPTSWAGQGQPDACMVVGTTISVASDVNVSGSRALVLVATQAITVSAVIDVASHRVGAKIGPAGNASACTAATPTPQDLSTGAGGGAGASFTTKGGDGGTGDNGGATAGVAAVADAANPLTLRGGCRGQNGGIGDQANNNGVGGNGGGALFLVAGDTITLASTGAINASGAAADFGGHTSGGGGGGSGGMIVLYAPTIVATGAKLLANGGGGSGGGAATTNGTPGSDPDPTTPLVVAAGGPGTSGAAGGNGFARGTDATGGGAGITGRGGGGGGGGAGFIRANVALTGAIVSPLENVVP